MPRTMKIKKEIEVTIKTQCPECGTDLVPSFSIPTWKCFGCGRVYREEELIINDSSEESIFNGGVGSK